MNYEQIWFRHNDAAVDTNDDHAMMRLVRDAQAGDDVAMAGLFVAMSEQRAALVWKFRGSVASLAGAGDDAFEATGTLSTGWVDSSIALAVAAFDCQASEHVARRLFLDARYILRQPGRRQGASVGVHIGQAEDAFLAAAQVNVEASAVSTGEEWLRESLWAMARGRESEERFAEMVDAIVLIWLHDRTVASAAEEVGVDVNSLRFYLKRSKAALATEDVRAQLAA